MPQRESHPITLEALKKWMPKAEKNLREFQGNGKKGFRDIDSVFRELIPGEQRILPEPYALIFALRDALCLYWYFGNILTERTGQAQKVAEAQLQGVSTTPEIQKGARFISAYAFFVAGSFVVAHCDRILRGKDPAGFPRLDTSDFEITVGHGFSNDTSFVLGEYAKALALSFGEEGEKLVQDGDDILAITRSFWKAATENAQKTCKEAPELIDVVATTTFRYDNFTITGLNSEDRKEAAIISFEKVKPSEVVGDTDKTVTMIRLCDRLALYDPVVEMNPIWHFGGMIPSMLVDGKPGTGKTRRYLMMMTRIYELAEMMGIPVHFNSLTADQIKSEWYGKAAQLIAERLAVVRNPSLLALIGFDDIDLLIPGNRNSDAINGADQDLMKAIMDFLSGAGTNYIGNYYVFGATNKPTAADDALRQRFAYRVEIKGPETAEDFADLVALELRKFQKTGLLQIGQGKYEPLKRALPPSLAVVYSAEVKERFKGKSVRGTWDDVGTLCEELKRKDPRFTGRPVKNAMQVALTQAADFDIPFEWFEHPDTFRQHPWERRLEMVKDLYKPVSTDVILLALLQQYEVEMRYIEEAHKQEVKEQAERMKTMQEAGSLVLGTSEK